MRLNDGWFDDDATEALRAWITGWRSQNPDVPQPPLKFAQHLGACVLELDVPRGKLAMLCKAAGYDEVCVCGQVP